MAWAEKKHLWVVLYVIMSVPMGHHTTLYMFYLRVPMGIMEKLGWVTYGALYVYVCGIPMGHQIKYVSGTYGEPHLRNYECTYGSPYNFVFVLSESTYGYHEKTRLSYLWGIIFICMRYTYGSSDQI